MNRKLVLCGICAGAINGVLGTGGGMILVPMLVTLVKLPEKEVFPTSLSIILPICAVSVLFTFKDTTPDWQNFLPYMAGGVIGGAAAGLIGQKIPVKWLHRLLGILIIWGGIQNLCF